MRNASRQRDISLSIFERKISPHDGNFSVSGSRSLSIALTHTFSLSLSLSVSLSRSLSRTRSLPRSLFLTTISLSLSAAFPRLYVRIQNTNSAMMPRKKYCGAEICTDSNTTESQRLVILDPNSQCAQDGQIECNKGKKVQGGENSLHAFFYRNSVLLSEGLFRSIRMDSPSREYSQSISLEPPGQLGSASSNAFCSTDHQSQTFQCSTNFNQ